MTTSGWLPTDASGWVTGVRRLVVPVKLVASAVLMARLLLREVTSSTSKAALLAAGAPSRLVVAQQLLQRLQHIVWGVAWLVGVGRVVGPPSGCLPLAAAQSSDLVEVSVLQLIKLELEDGSHHNSYFPPLLKILHREE
jgi:hypothetical protein